jgi:Spy/CpxP family protein refolding chaperone
VTPALRWKLIVGFLLVFVAGGMTGTFIGASHARYRFFGPHHGKLMSQKMLDHLRAELSLTDEQVSKISPIVDKTVARLDQIRRSTGERVHEVITEEHREMAAYLTEEQRAKLQNLEARHARWHDRYRELRGPSAQPQASPTAQSSPEDK